MFKFLTFYDNISGIALIILIKISNGPRWGKNTFLLIADALVILTEYLHCGRFNRSMGSGNRTFFLWWTLAFAS